MGKKQQTKIATRAKWFLESSHPWCLYIVRLIIAYWSGKSCYIGHWCVLTADGWHKSRLNQNFNSGFSSDFFFNTRSLYLCKVCPIHIYRLWYLWPYLKVMHTSEMIRLQSRVPLVRFSRTFDCFVRRVLLVQERAISGTSLILACVKGDDSRTRFRI